MIDEGKNGDESAALRRSRKTRLLHTEKLRARDSQSGDFPVFLVNRNQSKQYAEWTPQPASRLRNPFTPLIASFIAWATPQYAKAKEGLHTFWQRSRQLPLLLQREDVRWQVGRVVLISLLLPIALFATFGRAPPIEKKGEPISETLPSLPPVFDIEKRLAFARPLSDRLLSHALEQSFEQPAPSEQKAQTAEASPSDARAEQEKQAAAPVELDTDVSPPLQTAAEDQMSLPFDGQSYSPTALPKTPHGSFIAELAMSDLMNTGAERPRIAENQVQPIASPPKAKSKFKKVAARKKVIAQKKRPAQANQMTASASPPPAVVPQQPNLPPPPILFFLGAPPPSQP